MAGTYDGSAVRLYVDGAEVRSGTATSIPIGYGLPTTDDLFIGRYNGTCVLSFSGDIDEVRIWSRALAAGEISALADYGEFAISLAPTDAVNPAGSDHTLTATLTPALPTIPVRFAVTDGPNADETAVVMSDDAGQASFTYTGAGGAGVDSISACIDLDGDWTCEPPGEPTDTAAKEWLDQWVTGGGKINGPRGSTPWWTFGGTAGTFEDETGATIIAGQFQITGHGSATPCHFAVHSFAINSPTSVTFEGTSSCGEVTVTIEDNGEPGKGLDKIGWTATGLTGRSLAAIDGGNFQVHIED